MRSKKSGNASEFVFFDVLYEDGSRRSNRKVPTAEVTGFDGDAAAKPYLEGQDQKIAEMSGQPAGTIKTVSRSRAR